MGREATTAADGVRHFAGPFEALRPNMGFYPDISHPGKPSRQVCRSSLLLLT